MEHQIVASLILKPAPQLRALPRGKQLSHDVMEGYEIPVEHGDIAKIFLENHAFQILARTTVSISFRGPAALFLEVFGATITTEAVAVPGLAGANIRVLLDQTEQDLMHPDLEPVVDSIHLARPGVPLHQPTMPEDLDYTAIDPAKDLPRLLHADALHKAGITGRGVRISLVDTGFTTLVAEVKAAERPNRVKVDHDARAVEGVWLASDPYRVGTDYYAGGSFKERDISLGTPLPAANTAVLVVYWCVHPYYHHQKIRFSGIRAPAGIPIHGDRYGHGVAMASNILALAPEATLSVVKYLDRESKKAGWLSYPAVALQMAIQYQNPRIVVCNFGTLGYDPVLHLEIAHAMHRKILVVFPAGNGQTDDPSTLIQSVAQPAALCVGGAHMLPNKPLTASNLASSFDSFFYTDAQRHVPDLVGLSGEKPRGICIRMPTEPGSIMDQGYGARPADWDGWQVFPGNVALPQDTTAAVGLLIQQHPELAQMVGRNPRAVLIMLPETSRPLPVPGTEGQFPHYDETVDYEGWCVAGGTCAAAGQVAGVAALLLHKHPDLWPDAVRNILQSSARSVTSGSSNSCPPDVARAGWNPATGFGLVDAQAAVAWLQPDRFNAFVRDSVDDIGNEPGPGLQLWNSPDVIVRCEPLENPERELGDVVKHRGDLYDYVEDGQDNFVYLRVQNRGARAGDCTARVYFCDPTVFGNPSNWVLIGETTVPMLRPGEFRVVGPIEWSDAKIPRTGHFCMIAILDSPEDPAPDLKKVVDNNTFTQMVRDRNNVAWRNMEFVNVIPGQTYVSAFYLHGPPKKGHEADLTVDASGFMPGSQVHMRIVRRLAGTATPERFACVGRSPIYTTFVHQGGVARLKGMDLHSSERTRIVIHYTIPAGTPAGEYNLRSTFSVDGEPMGGYTVVASIARHTYIGNRETRLVHRQGCVYLLSMVTTNQEALPDLVEAAARGYQPCSHCCKDQ